MEFHQVKISKEGRVLIPANIRAELGLIEGNNLCVAIENGEIRLFDRAGALKRARDITRQFTKPGTSIVEELIASRRTESDA